MTESVILDSSAILAVIFGEPVRDRILDRLASVTLVAVGAPTVAEAAIVLCSRLNQDARPRLQEFLRELEAEIIPFTTEHLQLAVDAFLRYGKGRHAASLNFGDCLCYAVATVAGAPLLCTGDDFAKTDLDVA